MSSEEARAKDMRRIRKHVTAIRVMGIFIVALAVANIVEGIIFNINQGNQIKCQYNINQTFLNVIRDRSRLSTASTKNINDLITKVFSDKTQAQVQQDYQTYLAEAKTIDAQLRAATFPTFKECN